MKKIFLLFLLGSRFASAQTTDVQIQLHPDTSFHHVKWYQTAACKTTLAPALLIGYGIATMGDHEYPLSSGEIQEWRQSKFPTFKTDIDNYMPSASLVLMFGLDAAGVKSKNNWVNQAIIFGLSNALNGLATKKVKYITGIERPDHQDKLSFPSAHTSSAFVAAEMLHQEFKDQSIWISIAGYSLAGAVGALRVMNNRHWMSDVVAGAGFGILSVRLTYLVYPYFQRKVLERVRN